MEGAVTIYYSMAWYQTSSGIPQSLSLQPAQVLRMICGLACRANSLAWIQDPGCEQVCTSMPLPPPAGAAGRTPNTRSCY